MPPAPASREGAKSPRGPEPYWPFDRGHYIAGLDGVRAFSVLVVMVAHFGFGKIVPGGLGVTIFFFLSGFLITTLMLAEAARTGTVAIRDFYIRRFLRLNPELYAYIAVGAVIGHFTANPASLQDIAAGLLYFTNYIFAFFHSDNEAIGGPRFGQLWSLAVEEHFYLTFPLLFYALRRRHGRLLIALSAICVLALAWRTIVHGWGLPANYTYAASDCRIDSIAYGCIAAVLFNSHGQVLRRFPRLWLGALLAGGVLMLSTLVVRNPAFQQTLRYSLQGVALLLAFLGLFFSESGRRLRMGLEFAPLTWMGRRSYGAYLWHIEVLHTLQFFGAPDGRRLALAPHLGFALIQIALSFALAEASFRIFLRPVQGLRKRFSHA